MEHEKSNIYSNLSWTGIKPLKFHHKEVLNNNIYIKIMNAYIF
jgi:hypothetical protein